MSMWHNLDSLTPCIFMKGIQLFHNIFHSVVLFVVEKGCLRDTYDNMVTLWVCMWLQEDEKVWNAPVFVHQKMAPTVHVFCTEPIQRVPAAKRKPWGNQTFKGRLKNAFKSTFLSDIATFLFFRQNNFGMLVVTQHVQQCCSQLSRTVYTRSLSARRSRAFFIV